MTPVVDTDDGLRGIGDATLIGRELVIAAYLREHVIPSLIGRDIEETIDEVAKYVGRGDKPVRAQTAVPGLDKSYGVADDKLFYEPAGAGLPEVHEGSTSQYINFVPQVFEALRVEFGDDRCAVSTTARCGTGNSPSGHPRCLGFGPIDMGEPAHFRGVA